MKCGYAKNRFYSIVASLGFNRQKQGDWFCHVFNNTNTKVQSLPTYLKPVIIQGSAFLLLPCTSIYSILLYSLYYTELYCGALHCVFLVHCSALYCTVLHCTGEEVTVPCIYGTANTPYCVDNRPNTCNQTVTTISHL